MNNIFRILPYVILSIFIAFFAIKTLKRIIPNNDKYWQNLGKLDLQDSLNLDVRHFKLHHAALSFNGKYKLETWNLNYKILNGVRFEWESFAPPFKLEKSINSDTVYLHKAGDTYKFLVEK